jgi:hypothetical protein
MSIRLAMMDLPIMKRIIRSILEDGFLMNPMTLPLIGVKMRRKKLALI